MELSPSWEAVNRAATQEIPSILLNPKINYRVHKSPPLVPILSHINPIHTIPSYLSNLILSTHLRQGLPSGLLPSGFSTNILYAIVFSPIRATWPTHLILLDFIVLIIIGEEYKLWGPLIRSPPFKTILELVLWNGLQRCRRITSDVINVIKMPFNISFIFGNRKKSLGTRSVNR
jgi:hypothetical protein